MILKETNLTNRVTLIFVVVLTLFSNVQESIGQAWKSRVDELNNRNRIALNVAVAENNTAATISFDRLSFDNAGYYIEVGISDGDTSSSEEIYLGGGLKMRSGNFEYKVGVARASKSFHILDTEVIYRFGLISVGLNGYLGIAEKNIGTGLSLGFHF